MEDTGIAIVFGLILASIPVFIVGIVLGAIAAAAVCAIYATIYSVWILSDDGIQSIENLLVRAWNTPAVYWFYVRISGIRSTRTHPSVARGPRRGAFRSRCVCDCLATCRSILVVPRVTHAPLLFLVPSEARV